ncbi:hypothetical protein PENTCL1PPCAC_30644 [Pristionchus entomophagus]|uniref:C3H1-type domain-containing protein n=1 Tax=Pristionchus entomophagus TaxID=358040 RepID=A0AAV5UEJ7_9BILA|nr:hypothetical protein PENTCL1PPCAC_27262 [Pristionchus entomophagus]GMT08470.1 hypothetical protein PENTCL1PPCAC_30644 [Pristionchus entomophagus]
MIEAARPPLPSLLPSDSPRSPASSLLPPRSALSFRKIGEHVVRPGSKLCFEWAESGACKAGVFCNYEHGEGEERQEKSVCSRMLRGLCRGESTCPLSHDLLPHQMPICEHYLRMQCKHGPDECGLVHIKHNEKVPVCVFFNQGKCTKEDDCTFRHQYRSDVIRALGVHAPPRDPRGQSRTTRLPKGRALLTASAAAATAAPSSPTSSAMNSPSRTTVVAAAAVAADAPPEEEDTSTFAWIGPIPMADVENQSKNGDAVSTRTPRRSAASNKAWQRKPPMAAPVSVPSAARAAVAGAAGTPLPSLSRGLSDEEELEEASSELFPKPPPDVKKAAKRKGRPPKNGGVAGEEGGSGGGSSITSSSSISKKMKMEDGDDFDEMEDDEEGEFGGPPMLNIQTSRTPSFKRACSPTCTKRCCLTEDGKRVSRQTTTGVRTDQYDPPYNARQGGKRKPRPPKQPSEAPSGDNKKVRGPYKKRKEKTRKAVQRRYLS